MTSAQSGPERIDEQRLHAWTQLLEGHTRVMHELERELRDAHGLSLSEYDVLHRLQDADEHCLRMSELARALLYSTGGLTRLIDRMEKRALVERRTFSEDRRVTRVSITPEGEQSLRRASGTHLRGLQRHFGHLLHDDELPAVGAFLGRFAKG
ncbi:MarR family winged helix-turn-helix transcriptional regulator [Nesterenkonia sp. NBAIMH1]|uniref:MarR family winged helix-turn-helix transcriptional regulator n=1 Tax=Nesterenkonia sp. NBAIMH1 TaxID=2600320 RepID=UPI00143CECCC|nr:MarR family transcriptional regulator [Nesterenkonia sp. NBAIMH1]